MCAMDTNETRSRFEAGLESAGKKFLRCGRQTKNGMKSEIFNLNLSQMTAAIISRGRDRQTDRQALGHCALASQKVKTSDGRSGNLDG